MMEDELRIPPPGYRSAPQRRAEEMRRMLMVVGAAGLVLLLGIIGYFVVAGGGSDTVPLIQASTTPVKVKPENPGGLTVSTPTGALPGAGGQNVSLAPPPEKPDPAALAAQATQEQPPAQARTAPAPAPSSGSAVPSAPTSAAPSAPAVAIPSVPETAAAPGQKQAQTQAMNVPPPSKETAKVRNLAQEYAPSAGGSGSVKVQLAALDSKEAAQRAWTHLTQRMPGLFAGRHPMFVEAKVNGRTYWRVRMAGFRTRADADKFCQDVRAHGGACAIAAF